MTPEEEARQQIDRQLEASGWQAQDRAELNLFAQSGIAVREFPTATGPADYVLFPPFPVGSCGLAVLRGHREPTILAEAEEVRCLVPDLTTRAEQGEEGG